MEMESADIESLGLEERLNHERRKIFAGIQRKADGDGEEGDEEKQVVDEAVDEAADEEKEVAAEETKNPSEQILNEEEAKADDIAIEGDKALKKSIRQRVGDLFNRFKFKRFTKEIKEEAKETEQKSNEPQEKIEQDDAEKAEVADEEQEAVLVEK